MWKGTHTIFNMCHNWLTTVLRGSDQKEWSRTCTNTRQTDTQLIILTYMTLYYAYFVSFCISFTQLRHENWRWKKHQVVGEQPTIHFGTCWMTQRRRGLRTTTPCGRRSTADQPITILALWCTLVITLWAGPVGQSKDTFPHSGKVWGYCGTVNHKVLWRKKSFCVSWVGHSLGS